MTARQVPPEEGGPGWWLYEVAAMVQRWGELGSDAALPQGPFRVGLTHTPQGDSPPWTVIGGDGRAIAGHVPSKAIAEAIADAMNILHPPARPKRQR